MDEFVNDSQFDPEAHQPSNTQWIIIAVVGIALICGVLLVFSGGAFTIFSWYQDQTVKATQAAATATAVVAERQNNLTEAKNWPLQMLDTFDNNTNEWIDGPIDDDYAEIMVTIDGTYNWDITAKQGFVWRVWPTGADFPNFYLAVDAQNRSNNAAAQYGLIFHNIDQSYYYFEVYDSQQYRFLFLDQGTWTEVIPYTDTDAVRTGEVNHLAVISENGQFTLWINDQFVGQASGSHAKEGQMGVSVGLSRAGEQSDIVFDNFEVRTPNPAK